VRGEYTGYYAEIGFLGSKMPSKSSMIREGSPKDRMVNPCSPESG